MTVGVGEGGGVVILLEIGLCYTNRDKLRPCDLIAWSAPLPFFLLLIANWSIDTHSWCALFSRDTAVIRLRALGAYQITGPKREWALIRRWALIIFSQFSVCTVEPPSLVSDHLPWTTAKPKHQNFPSQSLTFGTSSKRPTPVSDRDHFLGVTVNDFPFFKL